MAVHVFTESIDELEMWIREEVAYPGIIRRGDRGMAPRRVQEQLTLQRFGLAIDGNFGPVTARQLRRFQQSVNLPSSGEVDEATHAELVRPMMQVLRQRLDGPMSVGEAIVTYANVHLDARPRELGAANRGPWVRLYMQGRDGPDWPWCAGFVRFVLGQACDSLQVEKPVAGSDSCDVLAAQAKAAGLFLSEADAKPEQLTPASIFLVRHTDTDWTHAGLVVGADPEGFDTIEGNTNADGDREGYEVAARFRGYGQKDFIVLP